MKLLLCPDCNDVRKLQLTPTYCSCMHSSGYYKEDGLNAVYSGNAIPIGFANNSLVEAVHKDQIYNDTGLTLSKGVRFEAFIIPRSASTIVFDNKEIDTND